MKTIKIILSLTIIVFLIALISPNMVSIEEVRPHEITCSKMDSIAQALKMFKLDNDNYPSKKEGLEALIVNLNPKKYPNYSSGSYMRELPRDIFNKPFIYIHYKTDKGDNFQLISFGADGKYGGEGENEDVIYPPIKKKEVGFFECLFK